MSNTEQSLSEEIRKITKFFDFDGQMHQNLRDLGEALGDRKVEIARDYWGFWRDLKIDPELDNPEYFEKAAQKNAVLYRRQILRLQFAEMGRVTAIAGHGRLRSRYSLHDGTGGDRKDQPRILPPADRQI